jgi:hypothetical protein
MKPKIINPGEPFTLGDITYTYQIKDGKLLLSKYNGEVKKKVSSAEFDVLWNLHAKGNKLTARQRFDKVISKVPLEELESKLKAYIQSNEFVYLKGLDVWLNPQKEYWNDPIVYKDGIKPEDKSNPMSGMIM